MSGLTRANLTTIATRTGHRVVAAWSDRDAGTMGTVAGVVMHHTGSAQNTSAVAPTLGIVREGRSDLRNALSTFYIDKAGTIYLITEKVAWHAGQGFYRGITDGNGHLLGIEAESDGITWTKATVDAYVALVAEICRFLGVDPAVWAIRHATWATPPGRKTDFAGLSEAGFKARVTARLNTPLEDIVDDTTIDRIATAVAAKVRADPFTIASGPGKGTKIAAQTALREIHQNLIEVRDSLRPQGVIASAVAAIKTKLGA